LRDSGKEEEAAELLAAALKDEILASDMDEEERAKLRSLLGDADQGLDDDAEKQKLRLEARRAERQKRRREAAQRAAAGGQDMGTSMDSMMNALIDEGAMSDEDAAEQEERLKEQLLKNKNNADRMLEDEAEAQRLKLEARRAKRAEARRQKMLQANELEKQGKHEEALEILDSLVRDDIDGSNVDWNEDRRMDPSVTEADRAKFKDLLSVGLDALSDIANDESETQLLRIEARRAARQKRRAEGRHRARELADQGKSSEAVAIMNSLAQEGDDSDSDWDENRVRRQQFDASVSDAERERLRMRMAAGVGQLADDDEAQRLKAEAKRAARQKRREAAQKQAHELSLQGRDEEAMEVMKDALKDEISESDIAWNAEEAMSGRNPLRISVSDADRGTLKAQLGMEGVDEESEAQRLKMESRRAERQKRREEAQKKAQEAAAKGDAKQAIEIMAAALDDEGSTSDIDFEERRASRKPLDATVTDADRSSLKNNLEHVQTALGDDSEAQRLKVEERRANRQKRREEAKAKAAKMEEEAAQLRANMALPGELVKKNSDDLDLLAQWQEEVRQRAAKGTFAEACQGNMETAARRILDSSVGEGDRSALKEAFAKEMEQCQDMVADEREAQKHKAQERLEARRRRREEAKKQDEAVKAKTNAKKLWNKTHDVIGGVKQIKKTHEQNLAKKLLEHSEIEKRVRAECEAEFKALEEKLRQKADEDIARLKAKLRAREEQKDDMKQAREAGVAMAAEAETLLESEKKKQAAKIEKRLADRKKRLQKREAVTRQGHAQEEVRMELEHEREKLHKKPIDQKKSRDLVKELYKVKNLINKLQDPDGNMSASRFEQRALTVQAVANLTPKGGIRAGLLPPQPPLSSVRTSGELGRTISAGQQSLSQSGRAVSGGLVGVLHETANTVNDEEESV